MYIFAMQGLAAARAGHPAHGVDGAAREDRRPRPIGPGSSAARRWDSPLAACIHPAHVPIINEEYCASAAEMDHASRLLAAFDAAEADGAGAVAFEGSMIDLPVVIRARRLLERAASWA
jgi:citrate lyase subunit beta/citryl-CoA lyase